MPTSNSFNFSLTRNDIINEAYRLSSIIDQESTPTATEYTNASQSLNIIMKRLMSRGVKLWTYEDIILFPVLGQKSYSLSSSGDRACYASDFVQTTLDGLVIAGATSFTVTDATGIAISDQIGLIINGVIEWHTVSNMVGDIITISSGLINSFADLSVVYSYTSKPPKPLRISNVMVALSATSDTIVIPISQREYGEMANKELTGNPNQYYFKPRIEDSQLFIYPQSDDESKYVKITIEKPYDDFDASTDTSPTPNEYYDIIIYSLAERLAFQGGFTEKSALLKARLDELITNHDLWDSSDVPIKMGFKNNTFRRRR